MPLPTHPKPHHLPINYISSMILCNHNNIQLVINQISMDRTLAQILHACQLARQLEANLLSLANQPTSLLNSCQDVARAFERATHELNSIQPPPSGDQMLFGEASVAVQAMDLLPHSSFYMEELPELGLEIPVMATGSGFVGGGGGEQHAAVAMEGTSSGSGRIRPAGSSGQRSSRKRKESTGMRTVTVPAVRTGNMDIPPDDGYTWRKYGQKDILNSRFPRSYYRCTHKSFYGCEAKKQVQRLDNDPYTYEVTYCGDHTCQTSPTPLILPPIAPAGNPQGEGAMPESTQLPSSLSTSIQLGSWINREFDGGRRDFRPHGGGESSTAAAQLGSSDCPVADFADAMFNSGSSGSSMDTIFSLQHESWKDKEE